MKNLRNDINKSVAENVTTGLERAVEDLRNNTPVDTGFARSQWGISL